MEIDPMLTEDFRPNSHDGYGLPGVVVQSARFGRTQVDVWREEEPGFIWRGEPARVVGRMPRRLWRYVVRGALSGVSVSEAGAKAAGERQAWRSDANMRSPERTAYRHRRSDADEQADRAAFRAMLDEVYRRYPADPALYAGDGAR